MEVSFHRHFKKQYKKLPKKVQKQFTDRLAIFLEYPNHPLLHIHTLQGVRYPCLSLNVSADYRAIFIYDNQSVIFLEIGSHSELYE